MNYLLPIQFPIDIKVVEDTYSSSFGRFEIGPLEPGYAVTLGSSLRRVLLSSLQGAAIRFVKIEGLHHELCPIPDSDSDYIDLILRLKQLVFQVDTVKETSLSLQVKGPGTITAKDIETPAGVRIINNDQYLFELVSDVDFRMDLWLGVGRGYVSSDDQDTNEKPVGVIPIDSIYSPVTKVNFFSSKQRVGEKIDYDKLLLDIHTDGSIEPKEALYVSAKYLKDLYQKFVCFDEEPSYLKATKLDPKLEEMDKILNLPVNEMELSVRSANCLEEASIQTIGDLVEKTEVEMLKYKNFGKKSLEEIKQLLAKFDLSLDMNMNSVKSEIEKAKKKMI